MPIAQTPAMQGKEGHVRPPCDAYPLVQSHSTTLVVKSDQYLLETMKRNRLRYGILAQADKYKELTARPQIMIVKTHTHSSFRWMV